ncbi:Arfaptin homology (AH) domain and Arfaptin homology (AH) domain/BAR domain-containing protein [Strongyloides ratti]|uniref:Arfaptin homology (AH) domain and Arfaptin homology (AH) domain/BAR domain-containing protein n=1 Tax=Strongyloides ratti TaxID=34506 RepID=A0A090L6W4_STRRB|nr:Arfaptin homology (AH) domain and Arfaptin homology (AH) domain/BAR domain-containing protein [Strongyloides ratti]CEF65487.1 Arfaptin homology (AH) domain and Arfaptin homology (AH) domain/BAR domain-containing protein [Strongyloides ratti]
MIRTQFKTVYPFEVSGNQLRMLQADIEAIEAKDIFAPDKTISVATDINDKTNSSNLPNICKTNNSPQSPTNNLPKIGSLNIQRADLDKVQEKIKVIKKWTVNTFKNTKQNVLEHLGKVEKTIDIETEGQIEGLKELHKRYNTLLATAVTFQNHFTVLNKANRDLAEGFYQIGLKETELTNECNDNHEILKTVSQNGELFEKEINKFIDAMETLCDKTMQDTFITIQMYSTTRLEYDVAKCELNDLKDSNKATNASIEEAEEKVREYKNKYEGMINDVRTKISLLKENRLKVMKNHMHAFQQAFRAYSKSNMITVNCHTSTSNSQSFLEH